MAHKHKWQFAGFTTLNHTHPNNISREVEFVCECGKVKKKKVK